MTTKAEIHALVDDLDEAKLGLAKRLLEEIRGNAFDLTAAEEQELLEREAECDEGETVDAREFLTALRREERADSNR